MAMGNLQHSANFGGPANRVLRPFTVLIISTICCLPSISRADNCDAALTRDYYNQVTDTKTTISLLKLIDESHFSDFKQKFSGNVIIPLDGVPVDFGADWSSYKQAVDRYASQLNINYSNEEYESIATSSVPEPARKDWLACKIITTPGSLFLEIDNLSADGSVVRITGEYSPERGRREDGTPDSANNPYVFSTGSSFVDQPPVSWAPNLQHTFSVKRDPKTDFFFTINLINGQANKLKLPPYSTVQQHSVSPRQRQMEIVVYAYLKSMILSRGWSKADHKSISVRI
jgi:hypothetical protein